MMESKQIKRTGKNIKLKISLGGGNSTLGQTSDIQNFVQEEEEKTINPVIDVETLRFNLHNSYINSGISLSFYSGGTYSASYLNAGFTQKEIQNYSDSLRNSFFIFDYYNSYEPTLRSRIFRGYYTKFDVFEKNFAADGVVLFKDTTQLKYLNIPKNHINAFSSNHITLYLSILFYNAKTGRITPFYNGDYFNAGQFTTTSAERMFFKVVVDRINKVWYIDTPSTIGGVKIVKARELSIDGNREYAKRITESIGKIEQHQQQYPEDEFFDYLTQTYVTK
jgi:hypothetical protein